MNSTQFGSRTADVMCSSLHDDIITAAAVSRSSPEPYLLETACFIYGSVFSD